MYFRTRRVDHASAQTDLRKRKRLPTTYVLSATMRCAKRDPWRTSRRWWLHTTKQSTSACQRTIWQLKSNNFAYFFSHRSRRRDTVVQDVRSTVRIYVVPWWVGCSLRPWSSAYLDGERARTLTTNGVRRPWKASSRSWRRQGRWRSWSGPYPRRTTTPNASP